jgi:hypothetical protein
MYFKLKLLAFVFLASQLNSFSQYQKFAESYGLLSTLAGKGALDANAPEWLPEYEGMNAIDAELTRPHFAMADTAGNIYIADKDAHGIRKVTPDGKIYTVAGTNIAGFNGDGPATECQLDAPNGLWVNSQGAVYILDLGNNKIRRLRTDGNLETIVDDEDGISLGRGLWVTNNEDTLFYAGLASIKMWTKEKGIDIYASGFSGLGNIVQDKNGFLVATDRSANYVYRISKDGLTKEIIAGNGKTSGGGDGYLATETALYGVRGVWFLDDNSYFVATHEGSQVWYIDVMGKIHLFVNGNSGDNNHSGDGENYDTQGYKISEVRSITADYKGNLIITENDKGYIRKVENNYLFYYTSLINKTNKAGLVNLYPNPASDEIHVQFFLNEPQKVTVSILNNLGQVIRSEENDYRKTGTHITKFNTSDLPDGIYFLRLSSLLTRNQTKFIIKN